MLQGERQAWEGRTGFAMVLPWGHGEIPNLAHYSDIVSDIPSGSILMAYIYSDIRSGILSGIYSWHSFWHQFFNSLSGIFSGIHSDILFGILSGMCSGPVVAGFGSRHGPGCVRSSPHGSDPFMPSPDELAEGGGGGGGGGTRKWN